MDGLLAIATTVLLLAPLYVAVLYQLDAFDSPEYLREHGVIVVNRNVIEFAGEIFGYWNGDVIYRELRFHGMLYEYARLASPGQSRRVGRDELYLEPGLIYVFKA